MPSIFVQHVQVQTSIHSINASFLTPLIVRNKTGIAMYLKKKKKSTISLKNLYYDVFSDENGTDFSTITSETWRRKNDSTLTNTYSNTHKRTLTSNKSHALFDKITIIFELFNYNFLVQAFSILCRMNKFNANKHMKKQTHKHTKNERKNKEWRTMESLVLSSFLSVWSFIAIIKYNFLSFSPTIYSAWMCMI